MKRRYTLWEFIAKWHPTSQTILFALALLCATLFLAAVFFPKQTPCDATVDFSDGWTKEWAEDLPYPAPLPTGIDTLESDFLVMKNTLPWTVRDYDHISFYSNHMDIDVFLRGTLIYHYDSIKINDCLKASLAKWHFVPLPYGKETGEITIVAYSPYTSHSIHVEDSSIGTQSALSTKVVSRHLPQFLVGLSIFIFGLIFFLVSVVSFRYAQSYYEMSCISLLCALVGVWMQCTCNMPSNFVLMDQYMAYFVAHNAIVLAPIPVLLFLKKKSKKGLAPWISALVSGCFYYWIFSNMLQFSGKFDYYESNAIQVLLLCCTLVIALLGLSVFADKKSSLSERAGYIVLLTVTVYELFLNKNYQPVGVSYLFQIGFLLGIIFLSLEAIQVVLWDVQQTAQLRQELKEKQEYISASQMKPHFIYNTLGAIKTMIYTNPDMAYSTMDVFSRYLRSVIGTREQETLIPFHRELDHIKAYCDIEQCRFQARVSVVYAIETENFSVPPISIQPIVENAIKHGIFHKEEGGTVKLTTLDQGSYVEIIVEDDGIGFNLGKQENASVGLSNISFRLENLLNAKLEIESVLQKGTRVTIKIPKKGG